MEISSEERGLASFRQNLDKEAYESAKELLSKQLQEKKPSRDGWLIIDGLRSSRWSNSATPSICIKIGENKEILEADLIAVMSEHETESMGSMDERTLRNQEEVIDSIIKELSGSFQVRGKDDEDNWEHAASLELESEEEWKEREARRQEFLANYKDDKPRRW